MASIKPFTSLRPDTDIAMKVAELPYDVVTSEEAKRIAWENKYSFFHITKPEIDFSSCIDPHDSRVYKKGRENFEKFISKGYLKKDKTSCFYLYTQVMKEHTQTGLVACVSVDDYKNNTIKKHELTREDKENDRTQHLDILNANTGPVFMLYKDNSIKAEIFQKALAINPEYQFTTEDGITHIVRKIDNSELIDAIRHSFIDDMLYIADGHHRAASAWRVCETRRKENPDYTGEEEFNWFLGVLFPHNQLQILPYNRALRNLNGLSSEELLSRISDSCEVTDINQDVPSKIHTFSLYVDGKWYTVTPRFDIPGDPVESLDVKILQETILRPIFGIDDPRTDERIDFIGGIKGTKELERLVDSGDFKAAFSLFPTTVEQLIEVSDNDGIMPPKSTWFEPKLRSGLFIHHL